MGFGGARPACSPAKEVISVGCSSADCSGAACKRQCGAIKRHVQNGDCVPESRGVSKRTHRLPL